MSEKTMPLGEYSSCRNCRRINHWGKFNCKKCSGFYTSEFLSDQPTERQRIKIRRSQSEPALAEVYDWLRENVFPKGYVNPSSSIYFSYKRAGTRGAWCNKNSKEIRFAPLPTVKRIYNEKDGFNSWSWKHKSPEEIEHQKMWLYETMLHEMIHLRMPNYRKNFKRKEAELLEVLKTKVLPIK